MPVPNKSCLDILPQDARNWAHHSSACQGGRLQKRERECSGISREMGIEASAPGLPSCTAYIHRWGEDFLEVPSRNDVSQAIVEDDGDRITWFD